MVYGIDKQEKNILLVTVIFLTSSSGYLLITHELPLLSASSDSTTNTSETFSETAQNIQVENTTSLANLFSNVENSVVSISADLGFMGGQTSGSGFIYDNKGHVVTNYHVIEGATVIDVTLINGNSYSANLVGGDKYSDLAVLALDEAALSKETITPLILGNSSLLTIGQQVVAIGNPVGLGGSVTHGIISQLNRLLPEAGNAFSIPGTIQTDAAINPGNSGGPLFNLAGEVIGVNTASFGSNPGNAGLNFAVSSNTVKKVVPELISSGVYRHPWLGITGTDVTPSDQRRLGLADAKGVMVTQAIPGTPSELAGIMPLDIIISIDNQPVRKLDDILNYLDAHRSVGETVTLSILRNGTSQDVDITLAERPERVTIRDEL